MYCGVSVSSEIHAVHMSSECCHTPSVAQTHKETDSQFSPEHFSELSEVS